MADEYKIDAFELGRLIGRAGLDALPGPVDDGGPRLVAVGGYDTLENPAPPRRVRLVKTVKPRYIPQPAVVGEITEFIEDPVGEGYARPMIPPSQFDERSPFRCYVQVLVDGNVIPNCVQASVADGEAWHEVVVDGVKEMDGPRPKVRRVRGEVRIRWAPLRYEDKHG